MKCYKCGAEVSAGAKFCSRCGCPQGFSTELLQNAVQGSQEAIAELYNRTYNSVYQSVRMLVKDEDIALDIVQDAYIRGFQHLEQLDEPNHFRAWMKRIGINTAKNYLKKKKPMLFSEMEYSEEEDRPELQFVDERQENLPEVFIDRKETTRLINEILDELSEEQRLVVTLYFYEEMNAREIADDLGISEDTVRSRLRYAKKKIETKVLEIEKRDGIRLHSLAPIPFLLLLFRSQKVYAAAMPPNTAVLHEVQKVTVKAVNTAVKTAGTAAEATVKTAAGTAAEATAKTAAGTAAEATAKTAATKAAAGVAAKGIGMKVAAGIIITAVTAGGITGVAYTMKQNTSLEANREAEEEEREEIHEEEASVEAESREVIDEKETEKEEASETDEADKVYSADLAKVMEKYGTENLKVNIDIENVVTSEDETYFEIPAQIIVTTLWESNPLEGKSPGDIIDIPLSELTGAEAKYTVYEGDYGYQREDGQWQISGEWETAVNVFGTEVYNGTLRIYNSDASEVYIYDEPGYHAQELTEVRAKNLVSGVTGAYAHLGIEEGYGTGDSSYIEGWGYLPEAMTDLGGYIVSLDENGYIISITQQWYS